MTNLSEEYLALCDKVMEYDIDAATWMREENPKRFGPERPSIMNSIYWEESPQGIDFWCRLYNLIDLNLPYELEKPIELPNTMTRKHFRLIAASFHKSWEETTDPIVRQGIIRVAKQLGIDIKAQYPNFNETTFLEAIKQ